MFFGLQGPDLPRKTGSHDSKICFSHMEHQLEHLDYEKPGIAYKDGSGLWFMGFSCFE